MTSLLNSFFNLDGKPKSVDDNSSQVRETNMNLNMATPALSQGSKFKKYQNKIVNNLEPKINNVNSKEGYENLTQNSNNVLSKTSISDQDKNTLENLKAEYKKTLDEYQTLLKKITQNTGEYLARTNNSYLGKNIRFKNKKLAYVTKQGVVKPYPNDEVFNAVVGKNGCPSSKEIIDLNIDWDISYDFPEVRLPMKPPLITGTPMNAGESCGFEGSNVFVNSMLGDAAPSHVGCYIDDYANPTLTYVDDKKPPRNSQPIMNGNFMIPKLSNNSYKYIANDTEVVGWDFNATVINNSNAWGYPTPYPNGKQAVSMQNQSSMSQTLYLESGKFELIFYSIGRRCCGKNGGANPINIYLDSNKIHSFAAATDKWRRNAIPLDISSPGDHTIKFEGTNTSGDKSTAIHDVVLKLVTSNSETGSFTFEQCKQYAVDNLFKFFSLQDVDKNTSKGFCAVTNDKPYFNCKTDSKQLDNQLYEFADVGNSKNMGLLAFIDPDSNLFPYASDNISLANSYTMMKNKDSTGFDIEGALLTGINVEECKTKCDSLEECYGFSYDTQNKICAPKNSSMYPKGQIQTKDNNDLYVRTRKPKNPPRGLLPNVSNINSILYENYSKGEGSMKESYGLPALNEVHKQELSQLRTRLDMLTKQIAQYSDRFYNDSHLINEQSDANIKGLSSYNADIKMVNKQIARFGSEYNRIADETNIEVLQANYTYMMWSILAVGTVLIGMNVLK